MKKNTIKAFTLVEMLIVIVIIGILIAALMPRMQAAQGRARDVSRKTALSQIQSAIVTSQGDKGEWPGKCADGADDNELCASHGMGVNGISGDLTTAGMNSVPQDPLKNDAMAGLGIYSKDGNGAGGYYGYLVTMRNGTADGGFVLMAKTEVEGGSNRVVCTDTDGKLEASKMDLEHGYIGGSEDIVNIHPCTEFIKDENDPNNCAVTGSKCTYYSDDQLRYIVLY